MVGERVGLSLALFAAEMSRGHMPRNTNLVCTVTFIRKSKKKNIQSMGESHKYDLQILRCQALPR
jgi:hypothetical protein